jgi:hypothetical protein
MSDTPRTDQMHAVAIGLHVVGDDYSVAYKEMRGHAGQLERELNEARKTIQRYEDLVIDEGLE